MQVVMSSVGYVAVIFSVASSMVEITSLKSTDSSYSRKSYYSYSISIVSVGSLMNSDSQSSWRTTKAPNLTQVISDINSSTSFYKLYVNQSEILKSGTSKSEVSYIISGSSFSGISNCEVY